MDVASGEGETGDAIAGAWRGAHETRDTFAGGEWPEIGSFVRAEVSAVSGEVVGGCCEAAVAPISAKKLAQQEWILEQTAKKFALQAKKR